MLTVSSGINILKLIRPYQWIKNSFVFLPMFFSGGMLDSYYWIQSIWAYFAFSLIASAVYCINDIMDAESDRKHPLKCRRPIASYAISAKLAVLVTVVLLTLCYIIVLIRFKQSLLLSLGIITLYFVLNIAYSLKFKLYAIIDVFIISIGFVLRLALGGAVCNIWLSPWIVCLTFLLALFLAFGKRRDDVLIHEKSGIVTRNNILRYNLEFLNQTLGILASITMVCYIIYSVSPDVELRLKSKYIYVTSVFVLAGILRYLQIIIVEKKSCSPTKVLIKDRFIQLCILLWISVFSIILYL